MKLSPNQTVHFFVIILLFSVLGVLNAVAAKTDIVILKNGDKITGEVKRMEYARLSFSTDAMKTLSIQWDEIHFLRAKAVFRIELDSELDFSGSIDTDTLRNKMVIRFDSLAYYTDFDQVVKIVPIKDTFLERLKVSADLGFNYNKASDVADLTLNGNGTYRSWQYLHEIKFKATITGKKDENPYQNMNSSWDSKRFFIHRWFVNGFLGAERNTEFGLNLRLLLGAGGGKDVFRTNTNLLVAGGGLQVTQEWKKDSKGGSTNLEALAALRFLKFKYDEPEIDFDTSVAVYPNLTNFGRIRLSFESNLTWEIYKDLFWKLTFYDNFDNQPPTEGADKNDYGITLSFGWSY